MKNTASENGFFSPSHTLSIDLIERPDGQFDTPVDVVYTDPNGKVWTAPARTITDGASIPSLISGLFGGKLNEEFLFAAIVHDAYCARANEGGPVYQVETWQDTHHMFYHACLANGTGIVKANTMYAGVRLGGPRWPFNGKACVDLSGCDEEVLRNEMDYCKSWIEAGGESLTLEDIDRWMEEREPALLAQSK